MQNFVNIIFIFLVLVFNVYGETANIPVPVPDVNLNSIVIHLFFIVIGGIVGYGFYFVLKNYIKHTIIALAIYSISLIILDYFNVITLNIENIKDYITELLAILLYLYNLIQAKVSFTLGFIIGLIYALNKDEKIEIPKIGKKEK